MQTNNMQPFLPHVDNTSHAMDAFEQHWLAGSFNPLRARRTPRPSLTC
jgi:hypothetical protein